jgi:hypothetical protein
MRDFYSDSAGRSEYMLMNPLILNRDTVKARVINDVVEQGMTSRRYAIGSLGVARVAEALPVLRTILGDESEVDYFRDDALESIYQINRSEGLALANVHRVRTDFLGKIAQGLVDGSHVPHECTYPEAAFDPNEYE